MQTFVLDIKLTILYYSYCKHSQLIDIFISRVATMHSDSTYTGDMMRLIYIDKSVHNTL